MSDDKIHQETSLSAASFSFWAAKCLFFVDVDTATSPQNVHLSLQNLCLSPGKQDS